VTPSQIIASLNSLHLGEMSSIRAKLDEAKRACLDLAQSDLAERLEEAENALGRADVKTYRKRVETVISHLGHLK
jgi:hypothetical protein